MYKALTTLHSAVTEEIFSRIMACDSAKEAWNLIEQEFYGSAKSRQMEVLNLKREFSVLQMSESETVKQFSDRVMKIVNRIRLLGGKLSDKRVVEKVLKERRVRIKKVKEGQLLKRRVEPKEFQRNFQGNRPGRQRQGIQCRACKQFGHIARNCKSKAESSQKANIVENLEQQEEKLFMATRVENCNVVGLNPTSWLIDSGCTHHMTADFSTFKSIDSSYNSKVRLENGDLVEVKGKGVAAVRTPSDTDVGSIIELSNLEENADNLSEQDFDDDYAIRGTKSLDDIYDRCNIAYEEPSNFNEAANSKDWSTAMEEDPKMIELNDTWKLVDRRKNKSVIGVKWVFRVKLNSDGSINKHKARLVAKDIKSAFLNGTLNEEIYVEQPQGYVQKGAEEKVYLLKKALYVLKQAPRAWYSKINDHLLKLGFEKSLSEATLYVKQKSEKLVIVSLYVYNILVTGSCEAALSQFKAEIMSLFNMNDLGKLSYFLGMEGTVDFGITYARTGDVKLIGYSNRDWAGSKDDMKGTSGYCFSLGSGMISWGSQKQQDSVAQSIAEAEYISAAVAVNQAVWLRKLLADVKYPQTKPTEMLCDNQPAVAIATNPVFHKRTKHIKIKYHTLRQAVQDGEIQLLYCSSEEQVADIFTKGLQKARFQYLRGTLGMCNVVVKEEC
ncbi:hypothetical protein SLEP1_g27312 [Rubroshorea leprosula]|uniref:CCHC-type domain-containing protein n=1 Tax=Rubroshorea leprosula TaxID=152421 RepID=A0AAV5K1C1_9ROSI|nr:hypothetical protein SLEP1_g27312 [Rubroshorea leprosula]